MSHLEHLETDGDPTCVMTYSRDGFGLGHLRRNTTIASRLVKQVPKSSVLILIGCPAGAAFKLPTSVDFIKLPSIIKQDTGVWRPLRLRIGLEKTKALRVATIQQLAHVFHPVPSTASALYLQEAKRDVGEQHPGWLERAEIMLDQGLRELKA